MVMYVYRKIIKGGITLNNRSHKFLGHVSQQYSCFVHVSEEMILYMKFNSSINNSGGSFSA